MTHFVPGRFDGKVALLTGAASGIGRATALQLHAEGAKILAVDVNAEGLASLLEETGDGLVEEGLEAVLVHVDGQHPGTLGVELERSGPSDPRCRTRQERHLPVEPAWNEMRHRRCSRGCARADRDGVSSSLHAGSRQS
jgi:hypothetical protein